MEEIYKKALKVQILSEVFKIARTKIHQNFLASKYDIKQHSDVIALTI